MIFFMMDTKESRILEAAASVFLRYGFRRTTMGDLAEAAGLSRPALYLRFCNKERIFEAVCRKYGTQILETLRAGLAQQATPRDKLRFAFELWVVQPWLLTAQSPDARDLAICGLEFAEDAVAAGYAGFEAEVRAILEAIPAVAGQPKADPAEVAHLLAWSARGFKVSARSVEELHRMIEGLLNLVLAALA